MNQRSQERRKMTLTRTFCGHIPTRSNSWEANENAQIVPDKELAFYANYFIGNDPSKWATHARVFQALLYKNIYPNIDVRYYSENGRLKYDLIVRSGWRCKQNRFAI